MQSFELSTPIQYHATVSKLAFIHHGKRLWPAVIYNSYGQAMQERYGDLSSKTKQMLFFRIIETKNDGKVAEVLGYDDLWVTDVGDTFDIYLHSPKAIEQNTQDVLGSTEWKAWKNAMNQVKEIMQRPDGTERVPIRNNLFPKETNDSRAKITPSTNSSGKSKRKKANKRKDDDRINKRKDDDRINKRKDDDRIWGAERKTKKVKRPSEETDNHEENFYVFRVLWMTLKSTGWKSIQAREKLYDWYYLRPGVESIDNAIRGRDYFTSPEGLIEWAKSENLHEQFNGMTDETSVSTPISGLTSAEDGSLVVYPSEVDDANLDSLTPNQQRRKLKFSHVWPILTKQDWTCVDGGDYFDNPEYATYYVRPGKNVIDGMYQEDYFGRVSDILDWLCKTGQGNNFIKEDIDSRSSKKESKKPKSKDNLVKERTHSEPKAKKLKKPKKVTRKREWFHDEPIPSFLGGKDSIYSMLKEKLHFFYSSGKYFLPKDAKKIPDVKLSFDYDYELRKFLCNHGIANYDKSMFNSHEEMILIRWTSFANVPVNSSNSMAKLNDVSLIGNEEAIVLIGKLQFKDLNTGSFLHEPSGEVFESIDEVRTYIRGMVELVKKEGKSRRKMKLPLDDNEVLHLRIWAAMSPSPLPTYGM